MRTFFAALGLFVSLPLLILNWVAGIAGGIWLAIIGEWRILFFGVIIMIIGTFVLSFPLMVGAGVAVVAGKVFERSKILAAPIFLFGFLFNFALIAFASVWVFDAVVNYRPHDSVWPYLLWAYAVATTPWSSMAQRERLSDPNTTSVMWVSAVQFGAVGISASVLVGMGYQTEFGMVLFFIPAALFGLLVGFFMISNATRGYALR